MSAQGQIAEQVRRLVDEGVAAARKEAAQAVAVLEKRLAVLEQQLQPQALTVSVSEDLPEPEADDPEETSPAPPRRGRPRKSTEG